MSQVIYRNHTLDVEAKPVGDGAYDVTLKYVINRETAFTGANLRHPAETGGHHHAPAIHDYKGLTGIVEAAVREASGNNALSVSIPNWPDYDLARLAYGGGITIQLSPQR